MRLTLKEVAQAVGGEIEGGAGERMVTGVSTDTRSIKKGQIFFALRGARDGHRFVPRAFRKGAVGAVVEKASDLSDRSDRSDKGIIRVPDTLRALGDLAAYWRRKFPIPVIGVTGSNGKTSTKEMIAAVLSPRYNVLKTEGNLNNLIGVPQTLFRIERNHEVAVIEMGMNALGEIHRLAEISGPQVGVVTNVGRAHLQGLKTVAGVARAKGELLTLLPKKGLAVLNQGDSPKLSRLSSAPVRTFGWGRRPEGREWISGEDLETDLRGSRFQARYRGASHRFALTLPGRHQAQNALAALAVGDYFGLSASAMRRALLKVKPVWGRMEILKLKKWIVINDSYNANPESMSAALEFLREVSRSERRPAVAILGGMFELGKTARKAHREIGKKAADVGIDRLVAVGPFASEMKRGAVEAGLERVKISSFRRLEEAFAPVKSLLRPGDLLLVKGSRGMGMERLIRFLKGSSTQG